ncbi:hypothetical protein GDO81_016896, partial [Engystomops pustulosus]
FPSFTLAVDTSGSMYYFIYEVQDVISTLISRLQAYTADATRKYTLIPFNDPSVGPLYATCSPSQFLNYVYSLYTSDGGDCPEYAMTGLLDALKVTPFGSLVVLVTDGSAKDSNNTDTVNQIFSLIESLKVKVSDLLNFFLKIPVNSTTRLFSENYSAYYNTSVSFYVPSNLTTLIISQSGSYPSLTLYNPLGARADFTTFLSEFWGSVGYLDYPRSGYWSFESNAYSSYSIRIEGYKDFCSRCSSNANCKKDVLDYTCVCKDGFSGDGYSCYDINECYYWPSPCGYYAYCINTYGSYNCVCSSGFISENNTCIDIDECSSPELNNCGQNAACENYNGSYYCYCPTGFFGDGYRCEVDECTKDVCGFGRECIKYYGYHTCSDPCFNYTTLNEPTRSTSYRDYYYYDYYYWYYGRSDYYLNGWYRFTGSGGSSLADFCPSQGSCYTRYPMWLQGAHPEPADGIVNGTVCTSYYDTCCMWTSSVKIKACPGGFNVYKFGYPPQYYSGYCTDPATVPDSCSCAADEECRKVGGRYSCYCKNDSGIAVLSDIRPVLSCGAQEMKASFQKCDLKKFNLNTKNIHLNDRYCIGFNDYNTTNIISVVSVLKNGVCGNEMVNNGTHVIFKNNIFLSLDTNSSLGGEDILSIRYSCVYPLDLELALETALKPFTDSAVVNVTGTGQLQVTMALYKDSSYTSPYEGSQVLLTAATNLFIGIILKVGDASQYAVQITNCYASPSINSTTRYDIIKNSCPNREDGTINVLENGVSPQGKFYFQVFKFVGDHNYVYLHCQVHLCRGSCVSACTRQKLGDGPSDNAQDLTFGIVSQATGIRM